MVKRKKTDARHHQLFPCAIEDCGKMGFRSISSLKRSWPFKPENSGKVCDYHYLQDYRMSKKAAQLEGTKSQKKQQWCCVADCDDPASSRTRFSLKGEYNFKDSYVTKGWNNICNYHYHSDLYKHKYNEHARSRRKRRDAAADEEEGDESMYYDDYSGSGVAGMDVDYDQRTSPDTDMDVDMESPYEKDSVEDDEYRLEIDEEESDDDSTYIPSNASVSSFGSYASPAQQYIPGYTSPSAPQIQSIAILDMAEKYSSYEKNKNFMLNPKRVMVMRWLRENGLLGNGPSM